MTPFVYIFFAQLLRNCHGNSFKGPKGCGNKKSHQFTGYFKINGPCLQSRLGIEIEAKGVSWFFRDLSELSTSIVQEVACNNFQASRLKTEDLKTSNIDLKRSI